MNLLQWEVKVPLYTNRFILKGLGIAIGIPFGILIIVIITLAKGDIMGTDAKYALFMIGMLFIFTYLFTMLIYRGKYAPGFIVDERGITNYTQENQAKKNRFINVILITFGLLQGNLTAAGTGFIAQSRQVMHIKWKKITKVIYYPNEYTILIKGGYTEKIAVFCTKENYETVVQMIKEKT